MILGNDNQKMSKSRGNVVNPDDIVRNYGADSMRVYEMFMGPLEVSKPWATAGLIGVSRFLEKVWAAAERVGGAGQSEKGREPSAELLKLLHKTIKKVSGDTATLNFNTAISAMMIFVNELGKLESVPRAIWEPFVLLLAPYAPHLCEELWERLGSRAGKPRPSIARESWPAYDEALCADEEKEIVVQVNGKIRDRFLSAAGTTEKILEDTALSLPKVKEWMEGKTVAKVVVVKEKLVNIVVR